MVIPASERAEDIDAAIESFAPRRAIWSWDFELGDFVRASVRKARPYNDRKAREMMSNGARHTFHAHRTLGYDLDADIWDTSLADVFLDTLSSDLTPRRIGQMRSSLHDLIRRYHAATDSVVWGELNARSIPNAPYTDGEIARMFSWARTRSRPESARIGHTVITLGLGFGLQSHEMLYARTDDFKDFGTDGILLTLQHPDTATHLLSQPNRSIWCDSAMEEDLRRILNARGPGAPLLERRTTTSLSHHLTLQRMRFQGTDSDALVPNILKLRATWLARRGSHLSGLVALMRSYGIAHTNTLQTLLPHLPDPEPDETKTLLRTVRTTPKGTTNAHHRHQR